jgi:dipeptidyl aminopeptidase/acylaminoacyl peptidase
MRAHNKTSALKAFFAATVFSAGFMPALEAQVDYNRAERLLGWHSTLLISGDQVSPVWMPDGNRFWYRNKTAGGAEFVMVSPSNGTRSLLFDNARLAAAMSVANDTSYDPIKLPFQTFDFGGTEQAIGFRADERRFECDIVAYSCVVGDTLPERRGFVGSPDGRWEAFIHEYNLFIRPVGGGDSTQLTDDGEEYWQYGNSAPRPGSIINKRISQPVLEWSPDSRKIAVQRLDERTVEHIALYSSTSQRPKLYTYPYAQPGDSVSPTYDIHIVDVDSRSNVRVQADPQPSPLLGLSGMGRAIGRDTAWVTIQWSPDVDKLYFTHGTRGAKRIQLMEADVGTGATRLIVKDSSSTYVELNLRYGSPPNWYVTRGGNDVFWFSERDGWGHLYRFDSEGNLRNQITSGPWTVGDVVHVDEAAQRIYFTARGHEEGRNPAIADYYAISFDGSNMRLLAGEHALRTLDGRVIRELERADVSRLEAIGWSPPEPFVVKARDGLTDIYGVLYKPSDFDSTKQYPIIDHIYPGPFIGSVGDWNFSMSRRGNQHALAEFGFIVVQIDHLGTPFRSKAFQDNYYGNMGDNGIPDHVTAIQQLASRHSFIDIDRVGIYGHSGGGFASTDAILRYPDFFKVAVSTAGNHDNRTYGHYWGEKYQGLLVRDTTDGTDNYENQVNFLLAENLKGKLFLMHGDMDDNVHPAMTIRVADALIKANKTFDFLLVPDRAHGLNEPYVIRRRWDYFVEHLLGKTPPAGYEITRPEN